MSQFSAVDAAPDIAALEAYLDRTARGLGAMKRYIVGAHIAAGSRVVLDVGCGVGHDLALLAQSGITAIGIEPSGAFAGIARQRTLGMHEGLVVVVQASGERLPLRDTAADGCRIERVLQHVADPALLLREALRCVRNGGLLTVFEPDWTTMRVASDHFDSDARWLANVRNPTVGRDLPNLVEQAHADVVDIVDEQSVWPSLARAEVGVNFARALERQVASGSMGRADAAMWFDDQRRRDRAGRFRATITKRLVVARVR
ncbi:MAG TPA: methyltransferase domain-containing protein [Acidimicrobiia bacterium]|jgi:SAM-dependent methyltransferase